MKKVTILSLDNQDIQTDSRVLRQVKYLSKNYQCHVIAYGRREELQGYQHQSLTIVGSLSEKPLRRKLKTISLLLLGKFIPGIFYQFWYWNRPGHQEAYHLLLAQNPDIIHANDWWTLPVAVRAAKNCHSKIVLDLHEFALEEFDNNTLWRFVYKPVVKYFLNKYIPIVDSVVTVGPFIAERYHREYNVNPLIIMNVPAPGNDIEFHPTNPRDIRIVHHGIADKNRNLELMIDTVALTDNRYSLHFMLFGNNKYISYLKTYANNVAPRKVYFHNPVPPLEIKNTLGKYDIGMFLLPDKNFHYLATLPNKFFEFISASLAVLVGPSPEMVKIASHYNFGFISPSFKPEDAARILNNLSSEDIDQKKQNSEKARQVLNADVEMRKLLDLYEELLNVEI